MVGAKIVKTHPHKIAEAIGWAMAIGTAIVGFAILILTQ
jgi:hypothetical protein